MTTVDVSVVKEKCISNVSLMEVLVAFITAVSVLVLCKEKAEKLLSWLRLMPVSGPAIPLLRTFVGTFLSYRRAENVVGR